MATISQIKKNVTDIVSDDRLRSLCLVLVDELAKHRNATPHLWTYQSLSKWINVKPDDPAFQDSIAILASNSAIKLLQIHFLLFDPDNPNDDGTPVEDEEVGNAIRTGFLYHPRTHERIEHFNDALVPYFMPSPKLVNASDA